MCLSLRLHAAAIDDAAANYLKLLKDATDSETVLQQTAISPYVSDYKKEKVHNNLVALYKSLREAGGEIKILESWVAEPLGGVVASAGDELLPQSLKTFPVAMVLRDGVWLPAPWLGSFANTNLGFDPQTRSQAMKVERWLGKQSGDLLLEQKKRARQNFFRLVKEEESYAQKEIRSPEQALDRFLFLCRTRNLAGVSYYLDRDVLKNGDLSTQWGVNLIRRFRSEKLDEGWSYLLDENCIIVSMNDSNGIEPVDSDEALYILGFFDPSGEFSLAFHWVEVNAEKQSNGKTKWDIVLAEEFNESSKEQFVDLSQQDEHYYENFIKVLRKRHPLDFKESIASIAMSVNTAVSNNDFGAFLSIWRDLAEEKDLISARVVWKSLISQQVTYDLFVEEGGVGAIVCSENLVVFAKQEESQWLLCSEWPEIKELFGPKRIQRINLQNRIADLQKSLKPSPQGIALNQVEQILKNQINQALKDDEAKRLIEDWFGALIENDTRKFVDCSRFVVSREKLEQSVSFFQEAGDLSTYAIQYILNQGPWTMVSVELDFPNFGSSKQLFFMTSSFQDKPIVLADLELNYPLKNRGQKLLLEKEFDAIRLKLGEEHAKTIRNLYKEGVAVYEIDRKIIEQHE